ncbi:MAG: trypsin-like peptidase domain-containing protein [Gemmatimonadales bacterium]
MTRSREWRRFGVLTAATFVLGVGFILSVDSTQPGNAEQRATHPLVLNINTQDVSTLPVQTAALSDAFAAVSEIVRPAVVFIRADIVAPSLQRQRQGTGSGFIISPDGYIITNNHVVEGAERNIVSLFDRREYSAELVGRDQNTDIAVLKIEAAGDLPTAALGNSDSVRVGEWVLAIGNPLGRTFAFTVTAGIVSAKGRLLQGLQNSNYAIHDFIQTDAAINPGNSGGPLVNIHGQVVGVNSALVSSTGLYTGYGFAVPMNLAYRVTEMLISEGRVTRSLLGVSIRDATPEDAEFVGLDSIYGVTIQSFSGTNSPAERAGLQLGDVIVELDGEPMQYTAQLQQEVGFKRPGEVVSVTVYRGGGVRRSYRVRLMEADLTPRALVAANTGTEGEIKDPSGTGLGIGVEPIEQASTRSTWVASIPEESRGPVVTSVDAQGPSFGPGRLRQDQIITHVDGRRVRTPEELRQAFEGTDPGTIVSLQLFQMVRFAGDSVVAQTAVARVRVADLR